MTGHRIRIRHEAGRQTVFLDGYAVEAVRVIYDSNGPGKPALITLTLPVAEADIEGEGVRVVRAVDSRAVLDALVPEGVKRRVEGP